jgi:hypothetical protein
MEHDAILTKKNPTKQQQQNCHDSKDKNILLRSQRTSTESPIANDKADDQQQGGPPLLQTPTVRQVQCSQAGRQQQQLFIADITVG